MKNIKYLILRTLFICLTTFYYTQTYATTQAICTDLQEQKFIQDFGGKYHISSGYIKEALAKAIFQQSTYNTQVAIANAPKNVRTKSWARYRKQFINPVVISRGQDFMCNHQDALNTAEQIYGVPASVIIGIIGVETSYGNFTGNYRVLDTLATLAFNSPRRVDFWQNELAQYLLMCSQNNLDPTALRGAIDGGFGLSQFMPSAYNNFAITTIKGKAPNLMQADDAIISVANYLKQHGWKKGQPVVLSVKQTKNTCHTLSCNNRELSYTIKEWQKNGVQIEHPTNSNEMADLVTLDDSYTPKAWLVLHNYYIIYSYNHSLKYAMVVYQLGNAVAKSVSKDGC